MKEFDIEEIRRIYKGMSHQWKILVNYEDYNLQEDKRILIPFENGNLWGFLNKNGEIVVPPVFDDVYGTKQNKYYI